MMGTLNTLWYRVSEEALQAARKACDAVAGGAQQSADILGGKNPDDFEPGTYWMPPAASANTDSVDWLFYAIVALTIFCFVGITISVVYFTWKYRHRPGHKAEPSASHNDALEITWTVIPSIFVVVIFVFGWEGFVDLYTPPKHAREIQVSASKWQWDFSYDVGEGRRFSTDVLHVPVNENVRMLMRSKDVLHSFFVPAFRVKSDVIPNRYTQVWFKATQPGVFRLTCAEYCGASPDPAVDIGHSTMKTWVKVHPPGGFEAWLKEADKAWECKLGEKPVEAGAELYTQKGCANCHSVDGSPSTGPTWKGLYGSNKEFTDGSSLTVDENYLQESMLDPSTKIVKGYSAQMPSFAGQLSELELYALIEYIKSLK